MCQIKNQLFYDGYHYYIYIWPIGFVLDLIWILNALSLSLMVGCDRECTQRCQTMRRQPSFSLSLSLSSLPNLPFDLIVLVIILIEIVRLFGKYHILSEITLPSRIRLAIWIFFPYKPNLFLIESPCSNFLSVLLNKFSYIYIYKNQNYCLLYEIVSNHPKVGVISWSAFTSMIDQKLFIVKLHFEYTCDSIIELAGNQPIWVKCNKCL